MLQRTVDITTGDTLEVEFSYSVKWKGTTIPYEHRMDRYARYSFLPQHLEVGGVSQLCHTQLNVCCLRSDLTSWLCSMGVFPQPWKDGREDLDRFRVWQHGVSSQNWSF